MEYKKYGRSRLLRHVLATPIIFLMIFPLALFDIFAEFYHRTCFPLYGIPYVKRKNYIMVWDRTKMRYLSFWNKISCAYCGYANGLMHYASAIAAETEKYWCGIKHMKRKGFVSPEHHKEFLEYGDEKSFKNFIKRSIKKEVKK